MHQAEAVLTEGGRKWLSQYTWKAPPNIIAGLSVTLPAWTNRQPDWRQEVLPTLVLDGEFDAVQGGGTNKSRSPLRALISLIPI